MKPEFLEGRWLCVDGTNATNVVPKDVFSAADWDFVWECSKEPFAGLPDATKGTLWEMFGLYLPDIGALAEVDEIVVMGGCGVRGSDPTSADCGDWYLYASRRAAREGFACVNDVCGICFEGYEECKHNS